MVGLGRRRKCYCAFCKSERTILTKRRAHISNFIGAGLASALVMFAIWQNFDPRVIPFFVVFLATSEIFLQIRWRLSVVCKHCGFDPILYLKQPELAAQKVKVFLEKRKADPGSLLRSPLKIPILYKRKSAESDTALKNAQKGDTQLSAQATKGRLVSKQI